ncbi:RCC1 domain-containing protein [Pseudomonas koreensis]|uniref:RCC1 domain-containing protein n=1 Tax=Pseudomonas koreensis TaxID=198620 RepID=UPI0018E6BCEB|nr:hypothetical protein [Pseudomonas koreensis]MBI6946542.1 hypothetical protein [Pseudomonas koreensis]
MTVNNPADSSPLVLKELDVPGRTGPVSQAPDVWGLNIAAVRDNFPKQGLLCRAGPWGVMSRGDHLVISLGGQTVFNKTVDEHEVDTTLSMFVPAARFSNGSTTLSYVVTRLGGAAEPSEVMQTLVKLTRPGGHDTDEGPGHPNLKMTIPREILEGGIDKNNVAAGVKITIGPSEGGPEPYPNAAAGDWIQVTWGGEFVLFGPLTQDEADGTVPLVLHITEATIRAVGDSDTAGLAVAYEVYDVADNRSEDWSYAQRIVVAVDADRLDAPICKEAVNNVLDADLLGGTDGTAQILAVDNNKFMVGDIPIVRLKGTPVEGAPINIEITGQPLGSVPSIPEIRIPNAALRQLAKTQISLSFRLKKADGSTDLLSRTQFINVIGEVKRLQAPVALDAAQGALDPELVQARIQIPFDKSFTARQAIKLFWLGTRPDLSTYLPDLPLRPITNGDITAGVPLLINVPGPHLKQIEGGKLELYYQLLSDDAVLGTMNRVNATHAIRESIHAEILNVGEPRKELPEPKVDGVVDGVLPAETAGTKLIVEYLNTVKDDEVFCVWLGSKAGRYEDSVKLSSFTAGQPVPFPISASLIKDNEGGTVEASYSIKWADGRTTSYSDVKVFLVGKPITFQINIVGKRSQLAPRYHSNVSRLVASLSVGAETSLSDRIIWTYDSTADGFVGDYFFDTNPEKPLTVIIQRDNEVIARTVLRPVNMAGIFNLDGRHSGSVVKDDGSVFGWGDNDEMLPPSGLSGVRCVISGGRAFAALKVDKTVHAWGSAPDGGVITPEIQAQLRNVKTIAATDGAFVAMTDDGQLVAWGNPKFGGVIPTAAVPLLFPAVKVLGNTADFTVLLRDGRVYSWGNTWPDGQWITQANGAIQFCASDQAFCALKEDHTVFAWGSPDHGGVIPETEANALVEVEHITSTSGAFAAQKFDGSVIAWGNERFGGKAPTNLQTVSHVVGSTTAFCALGRGGELSAWGEPAEGGTVPTGLPPTLSVSSSYGSFTAVLSTGLAVMWGVNTSSPSLAPIACAYATGPQVVLLSTDSKLLAVGPGAPDLSELSGLVSYTE